MHVLIVGMGWLGRALGRELQATGHRVTGLRSSADPTTEAGRAALPADADAVVVCAAPGRRGADAYRHTYVELNECLTRWVGERRYVYTGSTGVFGQDDGTWCDETTPVDPRSPSAEVLVEAEGIVRAAGGRVVRLSGLYGPGRSGIFDRVRSGRYALGPGDRAWTNWCHLDDAVAAVVAALHRGRAGAVYHGSDARPARREEVVRFVAERLGIDPPAFVEGVTAPARADRRISAEATRTELGFELRYPSFREGLAALLNEA